MFCLLDMTTKQKNEINELLFHLMVNSWALSCTHVISVIHGIVQRIINCVYHCTLATKNCFPVPSLRPFKNKDNHWVRHEKHIFAYKRHWVNVKWETCRQCDWKCNKKLKVQYVHPGCYYTIDNNIRTTSLNWFLSIACSLYNVAEVNACSFECEIQSANMNLPSF
mgnify:FL=1